MGAARESFLLGLKTLAVLLGAVLLFAGATEVVSEYLAGRGVAWGGLGAALAGVILVGWPLVVAVRELVARERAS
ncbi:MAG TPA: hypothetical protein VM889_12515 [Candidatus Thermoplasmatota archaeon]|nr:hypothetical protein [Candidatus Thermoplasmatota archaeon]